MGKSATLAVDVPAGQRFVAIRVRPRWDGPKPSKRTVCYQVDKLTTATGQQWIGNSRRHRDWDQACKICTHRTMSTPQMGVYVFPNDGGPLGDPGPLALRVVLRDCKTGVAADQTLNPDLPTWVHVDWVSEVERTDSIDRLDVALQSVASTPWADAAQDAQQLLRDAGIYATFRITEQLATAREREVQVRFVPCEDVPSTGHQDLLGVSPRIPGGMTDKGVVDGVFIATDGCGKSLSTPERARLLAHEVGHYLGLYHSDTAESSHRKASPPDIMHSSALSSAKQTGFTAAQAQVMRRHPYVWQRPL